MARGALGGREVRVELVAVLLDQVLDDQRRSLRPAERLDGLEPAVTSQDESFGVGDDGRVEAEAGDGRLQLPQLGP